MSQIAEGPAIPAVHTTALDGHSVDLPYDLRWRATILILGFTRDAAATTTAWEKPLQQQLAPENPYGLYDMAMLADVPAIARSFVLRRLRSAVPEVARPYVIPLFESEDDWKEIAGFSERNRDAAYVVLVDRSGRVRWSTHAGFSAESLHALSVAAAEVAGR